MNDYVATSNVNVTINAPLIDKQNPVTSQVNGAGNRAAAIGETVTYDILVSLPEGTNQAVVINDAIPTGMTYVSAVVFTTTTAPSPLTVAFTGALSAPTITPGTFGSGVAVKFDFGTVVVPATASSARSTFAIRVTTMVLNILGNQIAQASPLIAATTSFSNTANLSYTAGNTGTNTIVTDPTAPTAVFVVEPVLSLVKTIDTLPSPADAGGTVIYQIVISNSNGTDVSTAFDAVFTDTLPAQLNNAVITSTEVFTNGASAISPATVSSGNVISGMYTIPKNGSVTFKFSAVLQNSTTPVQTITNLGDLKWTSLNGPSASERTGADGLLSTNVLNNYNVQSSVNFTTTNASISKSLAGTSEPSTIDPNVTLGELISYDIKVTLPEGTAPTLVVSDTLPTGLIFVPGSESIVTATGTFPAGAPSLTQNFSDIGTLPTPTYSEPAGAGGGVFTATFSSILISGDNNANNNSFVVRFQARARNIVGNTGLTVATQTTLTNTGATVTAKAGTAATVTAPANVDVKVVEPQLTVTKSFNPTQAAPGDNVVINFVVTNTGLSNAFEPIIADILDANFVSITPGTTPAGYTYNFNVLTNTVTFTGGAGTFIAPGAPNAVTFGVNAIVKSTAASGTVINNVVTVSNPTTLSGTTNQTDERVEPNATGNANFTVITPDIRVLKNDGVSSTTVGSTLNYTITVFNDGLRSASNVTVLDTIPPNTTYSVTGSSAWIDPSTSVALVNGSQNPKQARIVIPTLAAGASQVFTLRLIVASTVPAGTTQISNTVTANDDGTHGADPTPANNTATDTDTLTGLHPDLAITKDDGQTTVGPNGVLAYTLIVTNNGNVGATGVKVTETIPANTKFVPGGSAWVKAGNIPLNAADAPGTVATVTLPGSLAAGSSTILTFIVQTNSTFPAGTKTIVNTTSVTDDGTNGVDPTPGDNTFTDTDNLTGVAPEISITKTDSTTTTAPNATRDYALTVTNNGNIGVTGVVISESIPANTTFVVAGSAAWVKPGNVALAAADAAGTASTFTLPGSLAAGASATIHFVTKANSTFPAGTTSITNNTSVTDDGTNGVDTNLTNNFASDTDTLTGVAPDLTITKTDSKTNVIPGAQNDYTLTITNAGNIGSTGIVVTETIPANTTFVVAGSAAWLKPGNIALTAADAAGTTATVTIPGPLAAGASTSLHFIVLIANPINAGVSSIINTASVIDDGTNGTDPTPGNNTASDTDTLDAFPDLVVTKTDGVASSIPGNTLMYTITVRNKGNQNATGVVVHDTVPREHDLCCVRQQRLD